MASKLNDLSAWTFFPVACSKLASDGWLDVGQMDLRIYSHHNVAFVAFHRNSVSPRFTWLLRAPAWIRTGALLVFMHTARPLQYVNSGFSAFVGPKSQMQAGDRVAVSTAAKIMRIFLRRAMQ
ncbi:hypothetical protein PoB_007483400 [Plakobranchus ocellatus]|uniref:Uncharacterized protein n=1 Tax=Plakobranchus ocellatus TaxID=259542 RepID=A0AAV4DW97_9GAST|nr:hypothetical protein PoB_007483400 [Plakobranchus ocellatus]